MHLREVMAPLSVKLLYGLCTLACANYVKNIKRRVPCLASPRLTSAAISREPSPLDGRSPVRWAFLPPSQHVRAECKTMWWCDTRRTASFSAICVVLCVDRIAVRPPPSLACHTENLTNADWPRLDRALRIRNTMQRCTPRCTGVQHTTYKRVAHACMRFGALLGWWWLAQGKGQGNVHQRAVQQL
jgi:hypothetical protein